jgi:hypothetical protein
MLSGINKCLSRKLNSSLQRHPLKLVIFSERKQVALQKITLITQHSKKTPVLHNSRKSNWANRHTLNCKVKMKVSLLVLEI